MRPSERSKAERFVAHLEPMQRQLSVYCSRAIIGPDEAADVLQSAVTTAFRDFDKYLEGTNFRAWMFRYVALEGLNRNRAAGRLPSELGEQDVPQRATWDLDTFSIKFLLDAPEAVLDHRDGVVAQNVNELTDQERSILLLRVVGDFKYREIAEILEIPKGTVMGLLSRARTQLRRKLLDYARQHGLLSKGDSV